MRIKELRQALKLTQEQLAFKADLDKTYVNEIERGKRNVGIINLEKIIKALGSTIQEFFNTKDFH